MKILITGATGFIGKHLVKEFDREKEDQDEIILLTSQKIEGYKCVIHKNYQFTSQDFLNDNIVDIDVVIHLGAFTPKANKYSNDINNTTSNIINTQHIINNLPNKPKKFVFCSTLDVYGAINGVISEESATIPLSLYGYSKLYCEKMLEEWAEENDVVLQILRIGHIYGEGEEKYQKILPVTIKNVIEDKQPTIYSDGSEIRSLLHVKDCSNAIIQSMKLQEYVGPINVVSDKGISILNLVKLVIEISEKNIKPIILNNKISTHNLIFDNNKMIKYLCTEQVNLKEGIKKEYEYIKAKKS